MQSYRKSNPEVADDYKYITVLFIPLYIHASGIVWFQSHQKFITV